MKRGLLISFAIQYPDGSFTFENVMGETSGPVTPQSIAEFSRKVAERFTTVPEPPPGIPAEVLAANPPPAPVVPRVTAIAVSALDSGAPAPKIIIPG